MPCLSRQMAVFAAALIASVVVTLPAPATAQDWRGTGRIEGVVTDEDGAPLPGVTVKAECAERGGGTSFKSDKKGRFVLGGVVGCDWGLDFEAEGYETKRISVVLPSESTRLLPLKLALKRAGPPPELKAAAEKADAAYKEGRFADARAEYEKLLAMRPDLAPLVEQQLGFSYLQEKRPADALAHLQKAVAAQPDNQQIRAIAAQAALEARMLPEARELLSKLDETKITNADVFFNMGVNFLNAGETADAIEYFGKAIRVDPGHAEAYYRRALGYVALGKTAEARADFRKLLELQQDGPMAEMAKKALEQLP